MFVRAIKEREAIRQNTVLVRKKPGTETYLNILRAIKAGANYPSMIVLATRVPWLTVMQCVRTLEMKGLIATGYDSASDRIISRLTDAGTNLLEDN